jgi:hypothetical protein
MLIIASVFRIEEQILLKIILNFCLVLIFGIYVLPIAPTTHKTEKIWVKGDREEDVWFAFQMAPVLEIGHDFSFKSVPHHNSLSSLISFNAV